MKKWDEIPVFMKNEQVKYYYNILKKKEQSHGFVSTFAQLFI